MRAYHRANGRKISLLEGPDQRPRIDQPSSVFHTFLISWLVTTVFLALVFFGSVSVVPFNIVAIDIFVLTLTVSVFWRVPQRVKMIYWMTAVIIAVLTSWICLQTISFPFVEPLWLEIANAASVQDPKTTISAAPADTLESVLRTSVPFAVFSVSLALSSSDRQSKLIVHSLAAMGGTLCLLGVIQYALSPELLLVSPKKYYLDSLTIVFVNRNTAATFAGCNVLILLAITWEALRDLSYHGRGTDRRKLVGSTVRPIAIVVLISFAILLLSSFTALLLTKSRAGIGSCFVALLYMLPSLTIYRPLRREPAAHTHIDRRNFFRLLGGVAFVLILFGLFSGQAVLRAQTVGFGDARFCVLPDIFKLLWDHYLTGIGPGSFQWVFPAYRDPHCGIFGIWDRAHNFYVEGIISLGIVFPILLALALSVVLSALCKGVAVRQSHRSFPILGIALVLLVCLHSLVDFSLQIPGFGIFFASLLGPIVSISKGKMSDPTVQSSKVV